MEALNYPQVVVRYFASQLGSQIFTSLIIYLIKNDVLSNDMLFYCAFIQGTYN